MTKNKQTSSIGCNLLHKTKTFETTSSQTKTHRFIFLISSSAQEVQMCELKSQTRAAHRCWHLLHTLQCVCPAQTNPRNSFIQSTGLSGTCTRQLAGTINLLNTFLSTHAMGRKLRPWDPRATINVSGQKYTGGQSQTNPGHPLQCWLPQAL